MSTATDTARRRWNGQSAEAAPTRRRQSETRAMDNAVADAEALIDQGYDRTNALAAEHARAAQPATVIALPAQRGPQHTGDDAA